MLRSHTDTMTDHSLSQSLTSSTVGLPETLKQLTQEMAKNPNYLSMLGPKDLAYFYRLTGEVIQTTHIKDKIVSLMLEKIKILSLQSSPIQVICDEITWQIALITELYDEIAELFNVRDHIFNLYSYFERLFSLEEINGFTTLHFINLGLSTLRVLAIKDPELDDLRQFVASFSTMINRVPDTIRNNRISSEFLNFRSKISTLQDEFQGILTTFMTKLCLCSAQFADPSDPDAYVHAHLRSAVWILEPIFRKLDNLKAKTDISHHWVSSALSYKNVVIEENIKLHALLQLAGNLDKNQQAYTTNIYNLIARVSPNSSTESLVAEHLATVIIYLEYDIIIDSLIDILKNTHQLAKNHTHLIRFNTELSAQLFNKLLKKISTRLLDLAKTSVNSNPSKYAVIIEAIVIFASLNDYLVTPLPVINNLTSALENSNLHLNVNNLIATKYNIEKYIFIMGNRISEIDASKLLLDSVDDALINILTANNTVYLPETAERLNVIIQLNPLLLCCFQPTTLSIFYKLHGNPEVMAENKKAILSVANNTVELMKQSVSLHSYYQGYHWLETFIDETCHIEDMNQWVYKLVVLLLVLKQKEITQNIEPYYSINAGLNLLLIINKMQTKDIFLLGLINSEFALIRRLSDVIKNTEISISLLNFRKRLQNMRDCSGLFTPLLNNLCYFAYKMIDYSDHFNHASLLLDLAKWNLEPVFGRVTHCLQSLNLSLVMVKNAIEIDPCGKNSTPHQLASVALRLAASHHPEALTNFNSIYILCILVDQTVTEENSQEVSECIVALSLIKESVNLELNNHDFDELKKMFLNVKDSISRSSHSDNSHRSSESIYEMTAFFDLVSKFWHSLKCLIERHINEPHVYKKLIGAAFALVMLSDAIAKSTNLPTLEIIHELYNYFKNKNSSNQEIIVATQQALNEYSSQLHPICDVRSCQLLQEQLNKLSENNSTPVNVSPPSPQISQFDNSPTSSVATLSFLAAVAATQRSIKETNPSNYNSNNRGPRS